MGISSISDQTSLSDINAIFTEEFLQGRQTNTKGLYLIRDIGILPPSFYEFSLSSAYICEGGGAELAFAGVIDGNNFAIILKSDQRNPVEHIFYIKKNELTLEEVTKLLASIIKPIDYLNDDNEFESRAFEIQGAEGISMRFLENKIQSAIQNNPLTKGCFLPSDNIRGQISALEDISKSWNSTALTQTIKSQVEGIGF